MNGAVRFFYKLREGYFIGCWIISNLKYDFKSIQMVKIKPLEDLVQDSNVFSLCDH